MFADDVDKIEKVGDGWRILKVPTPWLSMGWFMFDTLEKPLLLVTSKFMHNDPEGGDARPFRTADGAT